jgi:hypothetical protein
VDEGLPIAYQVLEDGVTVYAVEGTAVGTVDHVVAAEELDIFHGIVLRSDTGRRFVAAEQIASLHERGVDLRIGVVAVGELPPAAEAAPPVRAGGEDDKPTPWSHLVGLMGGNERRSR